MADQRHFGRFGLSQNGSSDDVFVIRFCAGGDQCATEYSKAFEHLEAPFQVTPGVVVPAGDYHFQLGLASLVGLGFAVVGRLEPYSSIMNGYL